MAVNAFGDRGDQSYSQMTGSGAQGYGGGSVNLGSSAGMFLGYDPSKIYGNPTPRQAESPGSYAVRTGQAPSGTITSGPHFDTATGTYVNNSAPQMHFDTATGTYVQQPVNLGSSAGMFLGYDASKIQGNPEPRQAESPQSAAVRESGGVGEPYGTLDMQPSSPGAGMFPGLFTGGAISNPNLIEGAVNEALNFGAPSGDSLGGLGKLIGLTPVVGPLMTIGGIMGDMGGTVDRSHGDPEAYQTPNPDVIGGGEVTLPVERDVRQLTDRPHRDTSLDSPLQFPLGQTSVSGAGGQGSLARFGQAYGTGGGYL